MSKFEFQYLEMFALHIWNMVANTGMHLFLLSVILSLSILFIT
jgi:hypothetical protein